MTRVTVQVIAIRDDLLGSTPDRVQMVHFRQAQANQLLDQLLRSFRTTVVRCSDGYHAARAYCLLSLLVAAGTACGRISASTHELGRAPRCQVG